MLQAGRGVLYLRSVENTNRTRGRLVECHWGIKTSYVLNVPMESNSAPAYTAVALLFGLLCMSSTVSDPKHEL